MKAATTNVGLISNIEAVSLSPFCSLEGFRGVYKGMDFYYDNGFLFIAGLSMSISSWVDFCAMEGGDQKRNVKLKTIRKLVRFLYKRALYLGEV